MLELFETPLTVLHIFVCFFLILVVLIQPGKSGGLGAALGGAGATQVFGGRGAGNFLSKATWACASTFFLTSIVLAYISSSADDSLKSRSVDVPTVSRDVKDPSDDNAAAGLVAADNAVDDNNPANAPAENAPAEPAEQVGEPVADEPVENAAEAAQENAAEAVPSSANTPAAAPSATAVTPKAPVAPVIPTPAIPAPPKPVAPVAPVGVAPTGAAPVAPAAPTAPAAPAPAPAAPAAPTAP